MLAESAMLVSLRITQLGLSGKSQEVTDAAHQAYKIPDQRAGYYRKFKVDRNDVKDISRVANMARGYHRLMTLPWGHDNYRLIPATLVQKYTRKIKSFKLEFEARVDDLKVKWPSVINAARQRLGPAFVQEEYASEDAVVKMYSFDVHFKPVPQDDHFILKVEKTTLNEIKKDLRDEERKNLEKITKDLWNRLYILVERMAERLNEKDPRIHKTLVSNIEELVDLLPEMNLTNDPKLNAMCTEVKQKLVVFTPGQLKKDKRARKQTADDARDIQNKMAVIMGKQ